MTCFLLVGKETYMKKTRYLATVAILAALAMILTLFRVPLPFLPSFYKLDFSESVIILGGYILTPLATVVMQLLKTLLKIITSGSNSAYVGDLANLIMGVAFVLPAAWYYHQNRNHQGVIIGLIIGIVVLTVVGCLVNYYILLPMYAGMYHMDIKDIIAMGTALNGNVTSLFSFVLLMTAPFNLIKGSASAVIVYLIYRSTYNVLFKNIENN